MMARDPVGTVALMDPAVAEQMNKSPATVEDMAMQE